MGRFSFTKFETKDRLGMLHIEVGMYSSEKIMHHLISYKYIPLLSFAENFDKSIPTYNWLG